jgi:hypothetical protein
MVITVIRRKVRKTILLRARHDLRPDMRGPQRASPLPMRLGHSGGAGGGVTNSARSTAYVGAAGPSYAPDYQLPLPIVQLAGCPCGIRHFFDGAAVSKLLDIRRLKNRSPDDLEKIAHSPTILEVDAFLAQRRADGRGVSEALERAAALRRAEIAAGKP